MRFLNTLKVNLGLVLAAAVVLLGFLAGTLNPPQPASAYTQYPPGALLQPGDVTTVHIRDNTILNADINSAAGIATSKLATSSALDLLTNATQTIAGAKTFSSIPATTGGNCAAGNDLCNKTYVDSAAGVQTFVGFAAQALAPGQAVYRLNDFGNVRAITMATVYNYSMCDGNGCQKIGQSFSLVTTSTPLGIYVNMNKGNAPTGTSTISIQTNSATSSPSGTSIASVSFSDTTLTTTPTWYNKVFTTTSTLNASTTYWIVWETTSAASASNIVRVQGSATNFYPRGVTRIYNGSDWTTVTPIAGSQAWNFDLGYSAVDLASSAATSTSDGFAGFASAAISAFASGTIKFSGVVTATSSGEPLNPGTDYFLSTNGNVSSTAGTISRKVGIGASSSTLQITNIW